MAKKPLKPAREELISSVLNLCGVRVATAARVVLSSLPRFLAVCFDLQHCQIIYDESNAYPYLFPLLLCGPESRAVKSLTAKRSRHSETNAFLHSRSGRGK